MALVLCRGCQRHVKRGEAVCPFCGTPQSSQGVLGRVLGTAMLVGVGMAVGSCGGEFVSGDDAGTTVDSGPVALYGPAPVDAGKPDSGTIDSGPVALYGPVPVDAATPDSSTPIDSGPVALYGPAPAYGPLPDAGKADASPPIDSGPVALYGPAPAYGPVPAYAATPLS